MSVLIINVAVHIRINTQTRLAFQKMEKNIIDNLEMEKENERQVRVSWEKEAATCMSIIPVGGKNFRLRWCELTHSSV